MVYHALVLLKLILESSLESQQKAEAALKDAFFQAQGYVNHKFLRLLLTCGSFEDMKHWPNFCKSMPPVLKLLM